MINLWVSPSEYEQLPDTVKKAMNLSDGAIQEMRITQIVYEEGRPCSTELIANRLAEQYNETPNIGWLQRKLHRMKKKKTLCLLPGNKGVYSLHPSMQAKSAEAGL